LARVNSSTTFGVLSKTTHWCRLQEGAAPCSRHATQSIIACCIAHSFLRPTLGGLGFFHSPIIAAQVLRLKMLLNGCIQQRVVLSIGLLGRQPLDQRREKLANS